MVLVISPFDLRLPLKSSAHALRIGTAELLQV